MRPDDLLAVETLARLRAALTLLQELPAPELVDPDGLHQVQGQLAEWCDSIERILVDDVGERAS